MIRCGRSDEESIPRHQIIRQNKKKSKKRCRLIDISGAHVVTAFKAFALVVHHARLVGGKVCAHFDGVVITMVDREVATIFSAAAAAVVRI